MLKKHHLWLGIVLLASCAKQGTWVPFTLSADKIKPGDVTQVDLGSIKYDENKVRFWLKFVFPAKEQFAITERQVEQHGSQIRQCVGRNATAMLIEVQVECSKRRVTFFSESGLIECGNGITVLGDRPKTNSVDNESEAIPPYVDAGDWFKYCKKSYEFWK